MREITAHYHLIIPTIISVVLMLYILFSRHFLINKLGKNLFIALTFFTAFYLFIVGQSLYFDIYYQWKLNSFDLNNDGFFSGDEITSEQLSAMHNLINDTPRNFSFIVGLIYSFVLSSILLIFMIVLKKIRKFIRKQTVA